MVVCVNAARNLESSYYDDFIWLFIQRGVPGKEPALAGAAEGIEV